MVSRWKVSSYSCRIKNEGKGMYIRKMSGVSCLAALSPAKAGGPIPLGILGLIPYFMQGKDERNLKAIELPFALTADPP